MTSSPTSSPAPLTIASSSESRSVRSTIERWICASRSSSPWRARSECTSSSVRTVWASACAIPRSSAASWTLNGSPSRASATQPPSKGECTQRQLAEPGHERAGDAPVRRGRLARGEARRRHDRTVADDHAGLGLERLGGALQARPHRAPATSSHAPSCDEVLRELLRGPAVRDVRSSERQDDERLVVEAADAARAGDLAVGVEAGDRRAAARRRRSARPRARCRRRRARRGARCSRTRARRAAASPLERRERVARTRRRWRRARTRRRPP